MDSFQSPASLSRQSSSDVDPDTAIGRAQRWLSNAGYALTTLARYEVRFERGSRWRTYLAMSPRGWFVTGVVTTRPDPNGNAIVTWYLDLDRRKTGQVVTPMEREYWEAEGAELLSFVTTGSGLGVDAAGSARWIGRKNLQATVLVVGFAIAGGVIGSVATAGNVLAAVWGGVIGAIAGSAIALRVLGFRWPLKG